MTQINPAEVDGRLEALVRQRNTALDQCVMLAGLLSVREAQIADLQEQVKKLTPEPEESARVLPFSQERLAEMARQQTNPS